MDQLESLSLQSSSPVSSNPGGSPDHMEPNRMLTGLPVMQVHKFFTFSSEVGVPSLFKSLLAFAMFKVLQRKKYRVLQRLFGVIN
ncbi:hypothetical protein FEM48_Zijuj12G0151500 [Ziziphus jujuba var. spinosa]|uniref:Uncharacterized protein n=1 Tax=Ziziphus jujuba var. spinosa TaxID=714518 RepID=A0A978UE21_ZIZJJ|nr:hypothetical protein FEM48_Zijuj12G0151500 [Ziziphus jujuba var. spinosa]